MLRPCSKTRRLGLPRSPLLWDSSLLGTSTARFEAFLDCLQCSTDRHGIEIHTNRTQNRWSRGTFDTSLHEMKVDLHSQVAMVTGAARGIGQAVAVALASNGARVIVADIDERAAADAAEQIPSAIPVRLDVSSEREVNDCMSKIENDFGRVDILVNNAGISVRSRVTVDQFPTSEWDAVMAVDLRGVFLASRAAAAAMLKRSSGRIVNIASVAGLIPLRLQCAYTSAKAGVVSLTRSMAIELAQKGIAINCVAPGSTLTAMTEKVFYGKDGSMAEHAQRLIDHIPAGRVGTVDEIAQAVLFFCDPEASYITGQVLCVDGGWTAGGFLRDF